MQNLLEKAIVFATQVHTGQTDKGGNPYILHPLAVMTRMRTTEGQIVAVLHDVLEDCDVTTEDLKQLGLTPEMIGAIEALTRKSNETYMEFITRCAQNPLANSVKREDIGENMDLSRIAEPSEADYARCRKYEKALRYLKKPHV